MSLEMVRKLYDYHRWANRRLFDVASTLGEEVVAGGLGALSRPPSKSTYPSMNAFKLRPRSGWRSLRSALASI